MSAKLHPRRHPSAHRTGIPVRYLQVSFLVLCTTIGCYLPAAFSPFGRPPEDAVPFRPPPQAIPEFISPPGASSLLEGAPKLESDQPALLSWQPTGGLHNWKYIVLHHTASDSGSVDSIDQTHRQRTDSSGIPWRGIGYHFVIGNGDGMADGEVQPTFRWMDQSAGAHAGDLEYNSYGIGICLVGNFDNQPPTASQLAAARKLVAELKAAFDIDSTAVLRHGDVKATECPGRFFPHDEIAHSVSHSQTGLSEH